MRTCPYCGSPRLQTVGGDYGNPFDRRRERTVCADCGRAVNIKSESFSPLKKKHGAPARKYNNGKRGE